MKIKVRLTFEFEKEVHPEDYLDTPDEDPELYDMPNPFARVLAAEHEYWKTNAWEVNNEQYKVTAVVVTPA